MAFLAVVSVCQRFSLRFTVSASLRICLALSFALSRFLTCTDILIWYNGLDMLELPNFEAEICAESCSQFNSLQLSETVVVQQYRLHPGRSALCNYTRMATLHPSFHCISVKSTPSTLAQEFSTSKIALILLQIVACD